MDGFSTLQDLNLTAFLAFIIAISQVLCIFARKDKELVYTLNNVMAVGQFIFLLSAFLYLLYAFLISDLSFSIVQKYSHTDMYIIHRISAMWGNHEGSLLLWILILSLFGASIALFEKRIPRNLKSNAISIQGGIGCLFYLLLFTTSNPFEKAQFIQQAGEGLNPILQDIGLVMHPPLLYIGYAGLSIIYSLAAASLISGICNKEWAKCTKRFLLISWSFLTLGITLGSYWAYYELGWGGWWFWDPVENVALIPWLVATALLHCIVVFEKRGSFAKWSMLLSMLSFILSVTGMFVVRSGAFVSVHSFSYDSTKGLFIISIVFILLIFGLYLFNFRYKKIPDSNNFDYISKESAVLFNNMFLLTSAATVLFGTFFPIIFEYLKAKKISVGAPYFSVVFSFIIVPMLVLLPIGSLLGWIKSDFKKVLKDIWPIAVLSSIVGIGVFFIQSQEQFYNYSRSSLLVPVGAALSVWILGGSIKDFLISMKTNSNNAYNLGVVVVMGRVLAHSGIGILLAGISFSSWNIEAIKSLDLGGNFSVGGYKVIFESINTAKNTNYESVTALVKIEDGYSNKIIIMKPEKRLYFPNKTVTNEVAIDGGFWRDLYIVLGERTSSGKWTFHVHIKPLVRWIWAGGIIIFFGGIVSLLANISSYNREKKYADKTC